MVKTGELSARGLAKEMLGEELADVVREEHKSLSDQVLNISKLTVMGSRDEKRSNESIIGNPSR